MDTDRESEQRQIECWRAMSPADKLRRVAELNAAADAMALAASGCVIRGIAPRTVPAAGNREVGRELAVQVYPEIDQLDTR